MFFKNKIPEQLVFTSENIGNCELFYLNTLITLPFYFDGLPSPFSINLS
jgi:hypothetical protein